MAGPKAKNVGARTFAALRARVRFPGVSWAIVGSRLVQSGTPTSVALLKKSGFTKILVESGAGAGASYADADYVKAGATIVNTSEAFGADVVLKLRPPSTAEVRTTHRGVERERKSLAAAGAVFKRARARARFPLSLSGRCGAWFPLSVARVSPIL